MTELDPVYFVQPVVVVAFSVGLVLFWHYNGRRLEIATLFFSAVAYFGAILLKVVVQSLTMGAITGEFGLTSVAIGLYLGMQTVLFEVGGAYLVAHYAISRRLMRGTDGVGYGISLAFWENGVLLGALPLLNLALLYILLSSGPVAQTLYRTLSASSPQLFLAPSQAIPNVALGILERVSSLLVHFAWGYLCVGAVVLHSRRYLAVALPMGLVDALVPFANTIPTWEFEAVTFVIALISFLLALALIRNASVAQPANSPEV